MDLLAHAQEVIRWCHVLAGCTEEPGHITRFSRSTPMREVHALLRGWMERLGMQVTVDAADNLCGSYEGGDSTAPRLLIGSHLDTVPHAGAFDGVLGVVLAIALVEARGGRRLPFGIHLLGFADEEGVRCAAFSGSRAFASTLENARGYLEFHIEQGPVLDSLDLPLAVVEAIAGQSRFEIHFEGHANHAGTTPMNLRRDALAGAAEWIGCVEREAAATAGLVATVGRIEAQPGAVNVIPGAVHASLDVRHASNEIRARAVRCLLSAAGEIARRRGLSMRSQPLLDQPAVALESRPVERAVEAAGYTLHRMFSGAGHDAMILAEKVPAAMLFLRSPGGISHHPDESVLTGDVAAALAVGLEFLDRYV
jgi:allantoate deiminase